MSVPRVPSAPKTCTAVWEQCLAYIKTQVDPQSFATWFAPIVPYRYDKQVLTIQVPTKFFYEWIEEHYFDLISKVLRDYVGPGGRLEYTILATSHTPANPVAPVPPKKTKLPKLPGLKDHFTPLHPLYTLDNLVEGDCNRLACVAAQAIIKKPGTTPFNPMILYTDNLVGLGKTHIAQAIVHGIREAYPLKKVVYIPANSFTSQFIDALRHNVLQDFIDYYMGVDALVMDDVQFLAGKEKTQELFFNLFNHLHQLDRQIVIVSDRKPRELVGLQERLLSRFKWGLTVSLEVPDFETRVAIIRKKLAQSQLKLAEELVEYLASGIETNVRDIEGVITSLAAHGVLQQAKIDLALIHQVLDDIDTRVPNEVSLDYIQKTVAAHCKVSVRDLTSKSRKRELVVARQIAIYFTKQHTDYSLKRIGQHFGGRDHSTIVYAIQSVQDRLATDRGFKATVEELKRMINRNIAPRSRGIVVDERK